MVGRIRSVSTRTFCTIVVVSTAAASAHASTHAAPQFGHALQPDVLGGYASDHILVKFAPAAFQASGRRPASISEPVGHLPLQLSPALAADCARMGIADMHRCHPRNFGNAELAARLGLDRTFVVEVPPGIDAPDLVAMLLTHRDEVVSAELDVIGGVAGFIPDDPDFPLQWGMSNTGQTSGTPGADVNAPEAWDIHTGDAGSVTIAIIDSGVSAHTEYASRLLLGYDLSSGSGVECQTIQDCADECPHGTHVAGIAAAQGDNGVGVAGMTWGANILPVDVLGSCLGTMSQCAGGIIWAVDHGADICSLSLQYYSDTGLQSLQDAVNYAEAQGVLVVAAAGNNFNPPDTVAFPARFPSVLAISATNDNDLLASFSNFGDQLDLAAPGDDIWSTWPLPSDSYRYLDGTSMATPHVSGLAALLMSYNSELRHDEIREILTCTADDIGPVGWDRMYGYGRINAFEAMLAADRKNARIEWIYPPADSIDARQPYLPSGAHPAGWQQFTVSFTIPVLDPALADFSVQQVGGIASLPSVNGIAKKSTEVYILTLANPFAAGAWTKIRYDVSCSAARLGFLPGDVNEDRSSKMGDVVHLTQALHGSVLLQEWQRDIDRNNDFDPADLLRLIDLMIGADAYPQYFGQSLPQ